MPVHIAIVLKGYPRLSETFIAQEILGLQRNGLNLELVSLRHPTDHARHPVHEEITAPVSYLPEYLHQEPTRVLRAWWAMRRRPEYAAVRKQWLNDLRRDPVRNRVRRFGQALVLAHELPEHVSWIYAHFMHTPTSVARYAAKLRGLPYSISAHAKDIWTIPDWEKTEKLVDCQWLATCTAANVAHLRGLVADPGKVHLLYHGLDFERFAPPALGDFSRDGRDAKKPVRLFSVGRAVEKKGYDDLMRALAALPPHLHWHFTHVGGGSVLSALKSQAETLGIHNRISWLGAQPQTQVLAAYRESDVFVLASRIGSDGDRDGLPNVLMEAQSQRLACLSTNISGIPELIENGVSGLLVEQRDCLELSAALEKLIAKPDLRRQLAEAGLQRVHEHFSMQAGIDRLAAMFKD